MEMVQLKGAACGACKDGVIAPFPFSMAFQPIVDIESEAVFAYEALVRGPNGESAHSVLSQVTEQNRYSFDQNCRVRAITLASKLGLPATKALLSINFMPGAVYSPAACIQLTLKTAHSLNFPLDRLIFEITEAEKVVDRSHLLYIVQEYRSCGFRVALDDFGEGWCGFNLLAEIPANVLKADMALTKDLHKRPRARAILQGLVQLCKALNMELIAEGIETVEEYSAVRDCGVTLMQGFLFARPAFEALPEISIPGLPALQRAG